MCLASSSFVFLRVKQQHNTWIEWTFNRMHVVNCNSFYLLHRICKSKQHICPSLVQFSQPSFRWIQFAKSLSCMQGVPVVLTQHLHSFFQHMPEMQLCFINSALLLMKFSKHVSSIQCIVMCFTQLLNLTFQCSLKEFHCFIRIVCKSAVESDVTCCLKSIRINRFKTLNLSY